MDWTAGYASDVEYTIGFYGEQSPGHLNFACLLNGIEPACLSGAFNYFELGFGRGLTVTVLAAGNPGGNFYAADFNPAHVASARAMASGAQLSNLTLLENSFEELAQGKVQDLPQFDYITLHGIYTWVTVENRHHIAAFIGRYLKPGGAVYLSYNAMPGWSAALPLQRLMVEYGDAFPNRSDVQMGGAAEFLRKLQEQQASYFTANPALKARMEIIAKGTSSYLVHEYMHKHWQPLYHADVARELAEAKMDFAASADLVFAFPALCLNPERQNLVATLPDSATRETIKDYFLNTGFRKDIFVRGLRRMGAARQIELLRQVTLALAVPRAAVVFKLKTAVGELPGNEQLYGAVCDELANKPHSLGELLALPSLKSHTLPMLTEIAALLVSSGQAVVFFPSGSKVESGPAHKLNHTLAAQLRYGDEYKVLCSPLIGSGLSTNFVERLLYAMLVQAKGKIEAPALKKQVGDYMASTDRHLLRDGVALAGEEHQAELNQRIDAFLNDTLPIWKQLRLL